MSRPPAILIVKPRQHHRHHSLHTPSATRARARRSSTSSRTAWLPLHLTSCSPMTLQTCLYACIATHSCVPLHPLARAHSSASVSHHPGRGRYRAESQDARRRVERRLRSQPGGRRCAHRANARWDLEQNVEWGAERNLQGPILTIEFGSRPRWERRRKSGARAMTKIGCVYDCRSVESAANVCLNWIKSF